ncbi:cadherin-23-like [Hippopotamus amphibius kiboko]|uniref:cadherin-23-like n=1 Tax=Hippopotamus amphibius kiboko TaxID=575201 RepID=UPI00259513AC|nr:cadherin-23-like [Hippopotamus amphibius kiboko]
MLTCVPVHVYLKRVCGLKHVCTDTHRHMGAYTMHSVCKYAHLQRQTSAQPGDPQACRCYSVSACGRVSTESRTHMWVPGLCIVRQLLEHCVHTCMDRPGWGCTPRQGLHTGGDVREPPTLPRSGQPQRLLGRQACSGRARGACSPLLCFLPSRALRPLPRHLRQSAKAAAARPRASHPVHLTSLPLIHRQPWLTGTGWGRGRVGGQVGPAVTPLPSGPGTPLTVLNGPILALDADLDVYAVVTYQLLGAQSGLFDIDNSTGVVTVRSGVVIDREAFSPPVLELLLLAEDIGLLNGTADLLVTILDDNDSRPTFSPAVLTIHLLENRPPGFSVLQVTATDEDSGLNGELIYRIEAGAQDRFIIHPATGIIRVSNATIDREEQESYRLTVVATDRGTVPLSGTAIITVLIDDINDSRPEFLNPIQTVSVLESAEPGTVIANVTAIDRDLNPKLEYHIINIVAKDDTDRLVPDQEDAFAVNINTASGTGSESRKRRRRRRQRPRGL